MGLWIAKPFHSRGYGSAVVRKIVEYGFKTLTLTKIEALVFVGNTASRKIFEKNGFKLEGTLRAAVKKREKFLDEWVMGILREDYELNSQSEKTKLRLHVLT